MQKLLVSIVCFSLCAALATAQDGKGEFGVDKGRGTWDLTSSTSGGKKITDDAIAKIKMVKTFKEGNYCLTTALTVPEFGTYTIDAKKQPAQIDLVVTTGKDKGKTQLGLIKIVGGDVMSIALSKVGSKVRPKDFEGGDGIDVSVFKYR